MKAGFPVARPGMRVGLLGGSFDPAHVGHAHITREALKRFGLDYVWWLISPGNPLKTVGPAPMSRRLETAHAVMQHPKVRVTDLETIFETRFTVDTLAALMAIYPGVKFTWLMGADNLAQFHQWEGWAWIMQHVRIGVLARPEQRTTARISPAAAKFERFRLPASQSQSLGGKEAPCWCFINVSMRDISSSEIRARGEWH